MEQEKALTILKALAEGIDPATGKPFPEDSPYQRGDTVRALYTALQMVQAAPLQPAVAQQLPAAQGSPVSVRANPARINAGRPWTEDEEAQLARAFDGGRTVNELAEEHKRSRAAIEARLAKLGKIPEPPSGMRFPIHRNGAAQTPAAYSSGR